MSTNKYKPHLLILPEDDANRQLANGFAMEVRDERQIQVLPEAGGWISVCEKFTADHIKGLHNYPERNLVLLVDFDGSADRPGKIGEWIPVDLKDRVFLLGVETEPEDLKKTLPGSLEDIGRMLGKDCREAGNDVWGHDLLRRNQQELRRLEQAVREFLF